MDGSRGVRRLAGALLAFLGGAVVVSLLSLGPLAEGQGVIEGLRRGVRAQNAFRQGKALYEAHDYERARERLMEALGLEPHHDEAQALLGWSEYFLGEHRAAIISFKTALQRQPTWEGLYNGLGWSRLRLRRYHLASEAFRAALDLNPDYVDAMIGLGSAQFELARYEMALPPLQTAMRRLEPMIGAEPEDLHGVRAKVAWSLYYLGRYQDALGQFQRALRARPEWHGLHNGVGWCQLKLGRKGDARVAFQRALSLKPDYEDALEGLRQTG